MYKRTALNGLALIALMLAGTAARADEGFYAGLGIGNASLEFDTGRDPDFPSSLDDSDTGFKVFGGYGINRYFAIELGYIDGGTAVVSVPLLFTTVAQEIEITGYTVSLVGTLPFTDTFSVFARLGNTWYDTDLAIKVGGTTAFADSRSEDDLSYGLGAAVNIGTRFQLRAEYEAIDIDAIDFNLISLSAVFRF